MIELPTGFAAHAANIGIKDETLDFGVVATNRPVPAAGLFTRSRFAGPSVSLSRRHLAGGTAQAIVVVSKNANVANGRAGESDAAELAELVGARLGCAADEVLVTSTGVIGVRYPMDRVREGVAQMPTEPDGSDASVLATSMMTTDSHPKVARAPVGDSSAVVVGVAKGVGMIEPDMATHLSFVLTDAEVSNEELDRLFRSVVADTFNCVSIDTDTSTSDSTIAMASGSAGPVPLAALEHAFREVCLDLTKQIARDGEGANSLLEVRVDAARDRAQALRVAKAIVNSPLVKTAVHGGDPNWGRVAMAIGKCSDDVDIDQDAVVIRFGADEVYPRRLDDGQLAALAAYMRGPEVLIHVSLRTGSAEATAYGCDLSDEYVRFNADYTT